MFERIENLADDILGIRAKGVVSKEDFQHFLVPQLQSAKQQDKKRKLLYQFGPDFRGFTPTAALTDMQTGIQYIHQIQRCAVVSDFGWIRTSAKAIGTTMPCPMQTFFNHRFNEAVEWLSAPIARSLHFRILPEKSLAIIEPKGKLGAEDFNLLETSMETWLQDSGKRLQGLVIHADSLPGWKDLGSGLRHYQFAKDHLDHFQRIALVSDSKLAAVTPVVTGKFTDTDIRHFKGNAMSEAMLWASKPRHSADML